MLKFVMEPHAFDKETTVIEGPSVHGILMQSDTRGQRKGRLEGGGVTIFLLILLLKLSFPPSCYFTAEATKMDSSNIG